MHSTSGLPLVSTTRSVPKPVYALIGMIQITATCLIDNVQLLKTVHAWQHIQAYFLKVRLSFVHYIQAIGCKESIHCTNGLLSHQTTLTL